MSGAPQQRGSQPVPAEERGRPKSTEIAQREPRRWRYTSAVHAARVINRVGSPR